MRFHFAGFSADPELFELRRGEQRIALEPKVLQLLLFLLENRDRTLTKAELLAGVWSDARVTEGSLSRALSLLREGLGDRNRPQPILQTVRGRGYRIAAPVEIGGPAIARPAVDDPFVGRADALEQLRSAWQGVVSGGWGRVVLLAGSAGIGKTRLADELAAGLPDGTAWVLRSWCSEELGAPPLWPWVEMLRSYASAPDAPPLGSLLPDAGDLLELAPQQSEWDRFQLYDRLARFLCAAAGQRPLLVIMDDLQRADRSSLRALSYAAHEIQTAPILLLGIYRQEVDDSSGDLLANLARTPGALCLSLAGLSTAEVRILAERLVGAQLSAPDLRALGERTGGNPLFVREFLRSARERGLLGSDASRWLQSLPRGVGGLIRERASRVSPGCREVLQGACIAGTRFSFELLRGMTRLAGGVLLDALAEAVAAGILEEDPANAGGYCFSHSLVRDALREELSPSLQQLELHARAVDVLEKLHAADLDAVAGELAEHALVLARAGGDFASAHAHALRAAERAASRLAHDEAALRYGQALEALEHLSPVDEARRLDLLLARADAQWRAGQRSTASRLFRRAAQAARVHGDRVRFARAALGCLDPFPDLASMESDASLVEEALAALGNADVGLRIRSLVRLGVHHCNWSELEKADRSLEEAVVLARNHGDPALAGLALRARGWLALACAEPARALPLASEARVLSERGGDALLAAEAGLDRLAALTALGEVVASEPEVERLVHEIESRRILVLEPFLTAQRAMRAALRGRFAEADRLVAQALSCAERVESPSARHVELAQRLWLGSLTGELTSELERLRYEAAQRPEFAAYRIALAHTCSELGMANAARSEFDLATQHGFARIPRGVTHLNLIANAADVCAFVEDESRAAELYPLLLPYSRLYAIQGGGISCSGSIARILGRLAAVLRRWQDAEQHFEDALAMNRHLGSPPWVARTQADCADMLLARGSAGDRSRAVELRLQALATARELGMRALEARLLGESALDTRDAWRVR